MTGAPGVILLVEDEADVRDTLQELLVEEGYKVACAASGVEALAWLASAPRPSLVLLDFFMPRMDGWTFLDRMLGDPTLRGIPVVAMSASVVEHPSITASLRKPFDVAALLGLVRQCVTLGN